MYTLEEGNGNSGRKQKTVGDGTSMPLAFSLLAPLCCVRPMWERGRCCIGCNITACFPLRDCHRQQQQQLEGISSEVQTRRIHSFSFLPCVALASPPGCGPTHLRMAKVHVTLSSVCAALVFFFVLALRLPLLGQSAARETTQRKVYCKGPIGTYVFNNKQGVTAKPASTE
ncbi:hypothetical protein DQ04_02951070 [Trypanosoma grayi]|uniref:hypothetical protein n=1 Tax=Trypanosoma grayi TaxID=71804 RepID=UPI0004F42D01|nr:hypothetical protein DQ04_02951070 [Trypanosoma grayi]KEG11129.1 hypothetical protein DQ04_02951070 [Trypanosoma grayi]